MKEQDIFTLGFEGGRERNLLFTKYTPNAIQVKRTRKRAIERARHLTKSRTIEVGDIVEVISNSSGGHEKGSICSVTSIKDGFHSKSYVILGIKSLWECNLLHKKEELKLIKKGSLK